MKLVLMIPRIVLYTKESCSLCSKARVMIHRVIEQQKYRVARVSFTEIDISQSSELEDRYGYSLPVITVNDAIVSELKVDGRAIRLALESVQ
jgi:glutaredoxin